MSLLQFEVVQVSRHVLYDAFSVEPPQFKTVDLDTLVYPLSQVMHDSTPVLSVPLLQHVAVDVAQFTPRTSMLESDGIHAICLQTVTSPKAVLGIVNIPIIIDGVISSDDFFIFRFPLFVCKQKTTKNLGGREVRKIIQCNDPTDFEHTCVLLYVCGNPTKVGINGISKPFWINDA